jgi:micrococcal nuclease
MTCGGVLIAGRAAWCAPLFLASLALAAGSDDVPRSDLPRPPSRDFRGAAACPVLEVRGGDGFVARVEGESRVFRLIGIDVPDDESTADEARAFLGRLLDGESVYVERDPNGPPRDGDQREWAYVYRAPDGLFVNLELLRQGYARLAVDEPFEHERLFRAHEAFARKQGKGVWAPRHDRRTEPRSTSRPATAAGPRRPEATAPADSELVYVTEHGKKYHRRKCQFVQGGATSLALKEAKAKGYTACSRCKPPE